MRITIIVHALTGGGAERVAASWANGLSEVNHEVSVLSDLRQPVTYMTSEKVKLLQRDCYKVKSNSFIEKVKAKLLNPIKAFRQYYRIMRYEKPDVLVSTLYLFPFMLVMASLLSGRKVPIIMTDHNAYERPKGVKMPWKQKAHKYIYNRYFDLVTVLTRRDKEILTKTGFKRVEVLYNPLFLKPVENVPKKEKIVLACGRGEAWHMKGFDVLLKAWGLISPGHKDWKLRIVGRMADKTKEWLKSLSGESAERVEFKSYTNEIVKEYTEAAIFVLSSRYEGWGLVLVEAMSQGCACVACDYKGRQAEIIEDGVNGLLCEPENVEELAKKIELLISDKSLREKLQTTAPESVEKFNELDTAKHFEKLIERICSPAE